MPIYEYKCQQCGVQFEKRQSVSDAPLATCEKCHGKLEKQWSLSGFQFKGAGWYVTDYGGKKGEKSDKGDKTDKSSPVESTATPDTASKSKSETTSATTDSVSKPGKE
jgi:putative FmdB family regulatory protein